MKTYKILLLLVTLTISSYAQITIHLQQPLPYQFKVEQFWKIVLINNSDRPVNVYLKGTATESLQGKIIEATSSVISLQPGVRNVSGRDLGPFTISESNSRYKNILLNTGGLPSGNYEICVAVFDALDGKQIATDCIQVAVENFNRMELISPFNGEVIGDISAEAIENLNLKSINKTPAIIFSWLPPVPVPPGARISYRLKLVEILGYQSVHSAMVANPMYYQSPNISATVLRYPVAARQLVPGKKYAWAIEVFIDDFKTQESEIRSFEIAGGDEIADKYSSDNSGLINRYGDADFNQHSGLPSGLSSFTNTNKNYGTSILNFFGAPAQIDLFGSPSNFKFFGDGKFTQISTSKPAQFSQLPSNYWTFEINPRLSVYDIPFGLNIYLSSLNNSNRQSLNSVSFMLDIDRLKSKIKDRISEKVKEAISAANSSLGKLDIEALSDPNKLAENAEKLGLISPAEKLFLNIKTLGIGRTYPDYSELTVSGVPVNGLNFEFNPGIFYFAVAAGNNSDGIDEVSFKRSFLAGRIGVGEKENAHFFLTALKMKDDLNSIQVSSSNSLSASSPLSASIPLLTPQENVVFGTEGKLILFKKLIEIDGEAAVSGFTRNLNDADFISGSIPNFVKNLLTPKLSTSFDYAWKGKIAFNHEPSATYLSLGAKRIGSGFMSLAAPNLRQDQFQLDFNFDQKFADRKITMKTFFRVYNDNLINWKQLTTTTISYGFNLGFYFPNLPFVQINYSPYSQSNDNVIAAQKMENRSDLFSLMTGYSYQLGSVYASTMFSFNGQWQNSQVGINSTKFSNKSYMLNQNLTFEFPLTLSSTLSMTQSKILSITSSITEFDLNGNYQLSEKISANLGGTISNEENYTKRTMIYMGSNIILAEWLRFELQGNISNYEDLSGGGADYNNSMLQASVLINW